MEFALVTDGRSSSSKVIDFSTNRKGCSCCMRSPMLGSARAQPLSYSAVKLFSKYSDLSRYGERYRLRRTGRRQYILRPHTGLTALCRA